MSDETVRVGFEVGTGEEVRVPLGHTILTGQTQASGKTTTLEAMARRYSEAHTGGTVGHRTFLAFRTKRGEAGFEPRDRAERLPPFFRERADWQFVQQLLEASLRERMKFERAWIMRATRHANNLRAVRVNVRNLLNDAKKGLDRDIYMMLGEYLDQVLPELLEIRQGDLTLTHGVNVMDLTSLSLAVQGLCVAACLDRINEVAEGVVAIIPESWELMPQGRNTPVKAAAEVTARKGGALGNFLWVDCQDLAGVEKVIIRGTRVWGLGVQREANEVERTLKHIPAGTRKPKPADVMDLERGQFWFCFDRVVRRAYVQPAWLDEATARDVAMGRRGPPVSPQRVQEVMDRTLGGEARALAPVVARRLAEGARQEMVRESEVAAHLLEGVPARGMSTWETAPETAPWAAPAANNEDEEEEMPGMVEAVEKMQATLERVISRIDQALGPQEVKRRARAEVGAEPVPAVTGGMPAGFEEAVYQRVLARLLKEPALVKVLATETRMEIHVVEKVIDVDGDSLRGRLGLLLAEGFFDGEGRSGQNAFDELIRRGAKVAKPSIYREMDLLTEDGFFVKETDSKKGNRYVAVPGRKPKVRRK